MSSALCPACVAKIEWRTGLEFMPGLGLNRVFAAGSFAGPLRDLIHAFKYRGKDFLAPVLAAYWGKRTLLVPEEIEAVCAVPMSAWKEWRRGYNQAHLLAQEIGKLWGKPVVDLGLRRGFWPTSQTVLNRRERFKNADTSFRIDLQRRFAYPRSVLLIDDVCTTGATLAACARLLKKVGVNRVLAGAVAREELK